jgi:voltage-gated potassium channel
MRRNRNRESALASRLFQQFVSAIASIARIFQHYRLALQRENALTIGALAILLLLGGSVAILLTEAAEYTDSFSSFGEALWFGVVTLTTVGYGDFTPKTGPGRIVAVILMLSGTVLLSLITGAIASAMVTTKIKRGRGLEVIDTVENHILMCGWNQNAERVLDGLIGISQEQQLVLVNEMPEATMNEVLTRYRERSIAYVYGDPANEAVLERANASRARSAIALADTSSGQAVASDERTMLITLALKSLRPDIKVTAEALDVKSEAHLRRAGADEIVITGEFNGFLLSSTAVAPGISQVVRGLLSGSRTGLCRRPIPREFVGRSFAELFQTLHRNQGFLTLAIVTENQRLNLDDLLDDDLSLVDRFIKQQFGEAGADFLRYEERGVRVTLNPADSFVIGEGDSVIGISGAI